MYMLPLLVSALSVNLLHGYLLFSQRFERKETISEHAAKHRQTHMLYIIGHTIGAVGFSLFAKQFFYEKHHARLLMVFVIIGAIAEIIQAILPARGKYKKTHELFAYTMAFMVVVVGLLAPLQIPQDNLIKTVSLILGVTVGALIVVIHLVDRRYFWMLQMAGTIIFHIEMLVLFIAG